MKNTSDPKTREALQGVLLPNSWPELPEGWEARFEVLDGLFVLKYFHTPSRGLPALLTIHGQGEHCGRYAHLPHFFKDRFDEIWTFDLPGHGRSSGIRGHVEHFDDYVSATEKVYAKIQSRPIRVLGHSMGGLIALRFLLKHPEIERAAVTSPLLALGVPVPKLKKWAGEVLNHVWGSFTMTSTLDPNLVSHDPEVVWAYRNDKLVHGTVTPRFFFGLLKVLDEMFQIPEGPQAQLKWWVAGADEIVDPKASERLFELWKKPGDAFVLLPGYRHEVMNEGAGYPKERVFEEMNIWFS